MEKVRFILASRLRAHRKRLGFKNQGQFAEHCEVSPDTIKKIEAGIMWPGPVILEKLAVGCGVTPGELLNDSSESSTAPASSSFHFVLDAYRSIPVEIVEKLANYPKDKMVWGLIRLAIRKQEEADAGAAYVKGKEPG